MMRVILVDDSRRHREAGVADLTTHGHKVAAFSDYVEAANAMKRSSFDVALLDLLMPAEGMLLGPEGQKHFGRPFPAGFAMSMFAAQQRIPWIAVATDTNHHDHPASAMLDWFKDQRMQVGDSVVMWIHAPLRDDGAKDWPAALQLLQRE